MAQDPDKPLDDGRVRLPAVAPGMNRIAPSDLHDDDKKVQFLRSSDQKQAEDDQAILARMRKRLDRCISAEADNRRDGSDDDKFYAGDQWTPEARSRRTAQRRPCQTVNKLPVLIKQVTNDQRQNRPSIDIHPVGDKGDVGVAQIYRDLIRHIERESHADTAYDTGFESAARKGWGYWRVTTEYESHDTFDQVICIERLLNTFSVYMDPDSVKADASDANFAFITEMIEREEFKAKYPDADPMPWVQGGFGDSLRTWADQYSVRIAEYYEIEHKPRELVMLENGFEGWLDELDREKAQSPIVQRRKVRVPKIMWYKATAAEILDRTPWLGQWIPIVRCVGDEIIIDGKLKYWGLVRFAKDPQRMLNYSRPLSLDTPVPTVGGWKTIADIAIGDRVFSENGTVCNVLGCSPTFLHRKCFQILFDNGDYVVADAEHPWPVLTKGRNSRGLVWARTELRTDELVANKHYVPQASPLQLPAAELPLHPYLLGVWLGNGAKAEPRLCFNATDVDEFKANLSSLGYACGPIRFENEQGSAAVFSVLGVRHIFVGLGLLGNKYIPQAYLRASEMQRWQLLQGLMDSDGTINPANYQCAITTVTRSILEGLEELLSSLGIQARIQHRAAEAMAFPNGRMYDCQEAFTLSFSCPWWEEVFWLARKKAVQCKERLTHIGRTKRPHKIVSIRETFSVPVRCITVDNSSHLFLVGRSMIPTHNSAETERVMLIPKAPYIIAEGQMEGYEDMWKTANTESYPALIYRVQELHGHLVPPPQRQPPVEVSAGIVNVANEAAQDMLATTGVRFDATLNERTYDESGRALRELRRSGDIGSFNLIDNCIQSKRRTGEILVDLIPKIYKRPNRVITILRKDDTEEQIRIDPSLSGEQHVQEQVNPNTQAIMRAFDPTFGRYGVTVTIGPSYATKRIETADSMMDFLRVLPNAAPLIADLVAKNQDWEGAEEIATRLAKTLPPGLNQPEMRDIPPQVQALLSQLQQQIQQLTVERQQLQAAVADRNADRQLARDRINRTFEVQLLNVVQKAHAAANKLHSDEARAERDSLHELASNVLDLYGELTKAESAPARQGDTAKSAPVERSRTGAGLGPPVAGARQAPDGEWYLPDPSRPGKYLHVSSARA